MRKPTVNAENNPEKRVEECAEHVHASTHVDANKTGEHEQCARRKALRTRATHALSAAIGTCGAMRRAHLNATVAALDQAASAEKAD